MVIGKIIRYVVGTVERYVVSIVVNIDELDEAGF